MDNVQGLRKMRKNKVVTEFAQSCFRAARLALIHWIHSSEDVHLPLPLIRSASQHAYSNSRLPPAVSGFTASPGHRYPATLHQIDSFCML